MNPFYYVFGAGLLIALLSRPRKKAAKKRPTRVEYYEGEETKAKPGRWDEIVAIGIFAVIYLVNYLRS